MHSTLKIVRGLRKTRKNCINRKANWQSDSQNTNNIEQRKERNFEAGALGTKKQDTRAARWGDEWEQVLGVCYGWWQPRGVSIWKGDFERWNIWDLAEATLQRVSIVLKLGHWEQNSTSGVIFLQSHLTIIVDFWEVDI